MAQNKLVTNLNVSDRSVIIDDFGLDVSENGGWLHFLADREEAHRVEAENLAKKEGLKEKREITNTEIAIIAAIIAGIGLIIAVLPFLFDLLSK